MKIIRYTVAILLIVFALPSTGMATKYAGEFLSIGAGARALGMGGAFAAVANDASACFWNPAGLPYIYNQQAIVMHSEQFKDLANYDVASYSHPFGEYSAFGATFVMLGIPDIADTRKAWNDANGNGIKDPGELDFDKITYKNDSEMALLLSYARWFAQGLSFGGNVKLIRKSVFEYSAWGLGLDIAAHYKLNDNISFGANLQDATTTPLIWNNKNGTTEIITPTLKTGTAYSAQLMGGDLTLAADVDWRFEGREESAEFNMGAISGDLKLGIEYWIKNRLAVRFGSNDGNLTAGAGIKVGIFQLDYAFLGHEELDNSHRVSAMVSF